MNLRVLQSPTPRGGGQLNPTLPTVIHSGDYFLFESDSEEEEEAQPEDPRPSAQSAFQVRWKGPLAAFPCPWSTWARPAQEGQMPPGPGDLPSPIQTS